MKKLLTKTLLSTTLFVSLTSFSIGVAGAGQHAIIIGGINVTNFMDDIGMTRAFADNVKIISSRGLIPDWRAAIAGSGKIVGDDGIIHPVKVFIVPFIDEKGIHHSTIIGGIGPAKHEFITIADRIDASIAPSIAVEQPTGIEIEPLSRAIQSGDRNRIWSIILSGKIPSASIRIAYESNGFACSAAPIGFQEKSIWYAATCIRAVH